MRHALAEAIWKNKLAIADTVTTTYFKRRPEMLERWGEVGIKRCTEDAAYHLSYLAESIRFNFPVLFVDYVAWAKVLLHALRIPESDLREHLELLPDALAKHLSHESADFASETVRQAVAALPGLPVEIPTFLHEDSPYSALTRRWLDLILAHNAREARQLIMEASVNGTPVSDLYQHVFTPTLHEIGRLWQTRQIDEADEHYCSQVTQSALAMLAPYTQTASRRKSIIGFCVANEQHEMGIRIVLDCFATQGWDTVCLGANLPARNMEQLLRKWMPDAVALSATMTYHLSSVADTVAAIKSARVEKSPRILVGERPFNICPGLREHVGADFTAQSCSGALGFLHVNL